MAILVFTSCKDEYKMKIVQWVIYVYILVSGLLLQASSVSWSSLSLRNGSAQALKVLNMRIILSLFNPESLNFSLNEAVFGVSIGP